MGYLDRVERKFFRKVWKFSQPFPYWDQEIAVEGHLFTKQGKVLTPLEFVQHRGQGLRVQTVLAFIPWNIHKALHLFQFSPEFALHPYTSPQKLESETKKACKLPVTFTFNYLPYASILFLILINTAIRVYHTCLPQAHVGVKIRYTWNSSGLFISLPALTFSLFPGEKHRFWKLLQRSHQRQDESTGPLEHNFPTIENHAFFQESYF